MLMAPTARSNCNNGALSIHGIALRSRVGRAVRFAEPGDDTRKVGKLFSAASSGKR
jgi:hypothetical protein